MYFSDFEQVTNEFTEIKKLKNASVGEPTSGGNDCFDDSDPDCAPSSGNPLTRSIPLVSYGDCNALVEFDLYLCYDPLTGDIRYVITNFSARPEPGSDCESLIDHWEYLLSTFQYSTLEAEMDAFYAEAKNELERIFMTSIILNDPTSFDCDNNPQYFSEFYTSQCFQWCVTTISGNPSYWLMEQVICGDKCCKKTVEWCWDSDLDEISMSSPSWYEFGDCNSTTLNPCLGTGVGDCEHDICEP